MGRLFRFFVSLRRALNAFGLGDDAWQAAPLAAQIASLLLFGSAMIGGYSVDVSFAGRMFFVLLSLAIAATIVNQWGAYRERFGRATYDMHPKDTITYLWRESKWGQQFCGDPAKFLRAVQMPIRDQLRSGNLKAQGRPSGKWGSGEFRYPADMLGPKFWAHGDLDWWRLLNKEYTGDVGAFSRGYNGEPAETFDDVMLSKKEVVAIWPRRSGLSRWRHEPTPIDPFENPPYGPEPWNEPTEETIRLDKLFSRLMTQVEKFAQIADQAARHEAIDVNLRDALSLGKLLSYGRPAGDWIGRLTDEVSTLKMIETGFWSDGAEIDWTTIDDTAPRHRRCAAKAQDGTSYYDLQFETAQVERLWPA